MQADGLLSIDRNWSDGKIRSKVFIPMVRMMFPLKSRARSELATNEVLLISVIALLRKYSSRREDKFSKDARAATLDRLLNERSRIESDDSDLKIS